MIQERGGIPERDMFNTFNMGIGMSLVVAADQADAVRAVLPDAVVIGEIVRGDDAITIA
jgi:phosphoribosylformylglycinamidine cyclo-ligase